MPSLVEPAHVSYSPTASSTASPSNIHAETSCTPSSGALEGPQTCNTQAHLPHGDVLHHETVQEEKDPPSFDCSICLDVCYDPVVTMCGHLFCWPCLYHWLCVSKACPVCKENVENRVIPIYSRGRVACPRYLAERFPGIHVPCRPSSILRMSEAPLRSTDFSGGAQYSPGQSRHRGRMLQRRAQSSNRGISHLWPDFLTSLVPSHILDHSLAGRTGMGFLAQRQRFNNEKEFVLQWGFIVFGLLATLGFIICGTRDVLR